MKISSRFSVAVHIISILELNNRPLLTSEYIAESVNTNPVVIRKILGMLKKAGVIDTNRGNGGAFLVKKVEDITLLDIFQAVSGIEEGKLFRIHENPNPDCPIGSNIQEVIDSSLKEAQLALENVLYNTTLGDITKKLAFKIDEK